MKEGTNMVQQDQRNELVRLMKSREKKNNYSQNRPCYSFGRPEGVDPGISDCSGICRDVYLRVCGFDIGGNTSAQVDNAKRGRNGAKIVQTPTGIQFDEGALLPGDLLYFRGNTAHTDDVGHVEMYTATNECYGHGSVLGPTKKNLKTYCAGRTGTRRALYAVRFIHDNDVPHAPGKLGDKPLVYGMKDPQVGELQRLLLKLGHNLGAFGPARDGVDNDCGAMTRDAVKAEQRFAGLGQTGNTDLVTIGRVIARANGLTPPPVMQTVLVTGGRVNIRKGPGTSYKIITTVKSGDRFTASGEATDGWIGIIYKDAKAWISAKYAVVE